MPGEQVDRGRGRGRSHGRVFEQQGEVSTPSLRTPALSSPSLVYECLFKTQGSVDSILAEGLGVDFACQEGLLPVTMETVKFQRSGMRGNIPGGSAKDSDDSERASPWEAEQDSSNARSGGGFRPVRAWASAGASAQRWNPQDVRYRGRQRRLFEGNRGRGNMRPGEGYDTPRRDAQQPELVTFNHFSTKKPVEELHALDQSHGHVRFGGAGPVVEFEKREAATGAEETRPVAAVQDDLGEEQARLEQEARVKQSWEAHRKVEAEWQDFLKQQASKKKELARMLSGDAIITADHGKEKVEERRDIRPHNQQWRTEQQKWAEQVSAIEGRMGDGRNWRIQQRSAYSDQGPYRGLTEGMLPHQIRELGTENADGWRQPQELPSAPPYLHRNMEGKREDRTVWTDNEENLFSRDARMRARERQECHAEDVQGHTHLARSATGQEGMRMQHRPVEGEAWRGQVAAPVRNAYERMTGWNPVAEAEMYRRRGMAVPPAIWHETGNGPVPTGEVFPGATTEHRSYDSGEYGMRQFTPTVPPLVYQQGVIPDRWPLDGRNCEPRSGVQQEVVPPRVWGVRDHGLSKMTNGGSPQVWTWSSSSPGAGIVAALPTSQPNSGSRWDTKVVPIEWPRLGGGPPPVDRINMKLPMFTGGKQPTLTEDAEQWLNILGAAVSNNMWTFDQAFKMIQSHLQGAAATWYGSYGNYFRTHPEGRYVGWHAFWVEFEARFVVRDESQLEAALQNRVQRTNESIMDFADSLRVLAAKLGISCDSRRVRMLFLNGLHNQQVRQGIMLHAVVRMTSETLRGVVAMALEYEDFLATEKVTMKQAKQSPKEVGTKAESAKDGRLLKPPGEVKESEGEAAGWKQAWQKQAKQIDELYKRQTGLSQTLAKSTQQATAPARKPLSEIQCNNCKEMGHFARNCPHPRKEYRAAAKSVHFLEEDLDQIRMTDEVEPGWYPLEDVCEEQFAGTENPLFEEEGGSWDEVCTLNVGCAPTEGGAMLYRCRQLKEAPIEQSSTPRLDPRHTWVRVNAEGKITGKYVAALGESMREVGHNIAKLGPKGAPPAGKLIPEQPSKEQRTNQKPQAASWPSAYDPAAPPLPGVVYQPCYTAYLPATILGVGVNCLLDTGATISVLTVASVRKLKLQGAVQKTNKCFYTASAQCVPACGELPQLPVTVDGVSVPVNFYIVPKGGYELLIGMDFLVPRCAVVDLGRATLSFAKQIVPGDDYVVMKKVKLDIRQTTASPLSYLRNCTVIETEDWRSFPSAEECHEFSMEGNSPFVLEDAALSTPWSVLPGEAQPPEDITASQFFDTDFHSAVHSFSVPGTHELPPHSLDKFVETSGTGRSEGYNVKTYTESLIQQNPTAMPCLCVEEVTLPRLEEFTPPPALEELKLQMQQSKELKQPKLEELKQQTVSETCVLNSKLDEKEKKMGKRRAEEQKVEIELRLEEPNTDTGMYTTCVDQSAGLGCLDERVWERVTGRKGLDGLLQGEYAASESEFVRELGEDRAAARRDKGRLDTERLEGNTGVLMGALDDGRSGRWNWFGRTGVTVKLEQSESEESEELEITKGQAGELGVDAAAALKTSVILRASVHESLSYAERLKLLVEKKTVSSREESLERGMTGQKTNKAVGSVKLAYPKNMFSQKMLELEQKEWEEECKEFVTSPGKFRFPVVVPKSPSTLVVKEETDVPAPDQRNLQSQKNATQYVSASAGGETGSQENLTQYVSARSEGEDVYLDANCFTFSNVCTAKVEVGFPDNIQMGGHLTAEQKKMVRELVLEFAEIFEDDPYQLTCSTMEPHMIETGDARPINIPPYRYSQKECDAIEIEVTKMLQLGIIEPSNSPWSASVVAVIKKDLTLRICVDFRELNKVTKSDTYPIPLIEDMLDRLAGSDCFSSLDLRSAFWQVMMAECSKEKTAFSTKTGHYQFKRMPFGLKNALPTFQRGADDKFRGMQKSCQQYVDDITAHGKGFKAGMNSLRGVFLVCRESILKIKAAKTMLIMQSIDYLGFVVSGEGVKPDPRRVEAILKLQVPTDVTGVRSAIGIQYKRYMPEFSKEAAVLNDMVKKGKSWNWTADCELAWQKLKRLLTSAPLLAHPNLQMTMVVQSDWSPRAVGAVLSQRQYTKNGEVVREEVVAYYSKKLNDAEQNYSATEGECLAVVRAIGNWHKYLFGRRFIVETDHLALRWLMQARNLDGRVARWSVKLMPYEFSIVYRRGSKHLAADAMSRLRQVRVEELITFCVTIECLQEKPLSKEQLALIEMVPVEDCEAQLLGVWCAEEDSERKNYSDPMRWAAYQLKLGAWYVGMPEGISLIACISRVATDVFSSQLSDEEQRNQERSKPRVSEDTATLHVPAEASRSWGRQRAEWPSATARGRSKFEEPRRPPGLERHVEDQMKLRERQEYEDHMKMLGGQSEGKPNALRESYLAFAQQLRAGQSGG